MDDETIRLRVTTSFVQDADSLELRFPPEYSDEIRALLDEHGIEHNTAAEFHANPQDWIEVVTGLGTAAGATSGGLLGLAAVIRAFMRRNDGKRVVLKNGELKEAHGFSEREVEQLLDKSAKRQAELNAEWKKMRGD
ncbi:hypothetical protein [Agromyces laixinhei]|uniref:hypothetical protein n=1 Tax=Agromyces laixinhei TaxID=2585717 RepID=UPI0012ED19B0|nr:hypothetical protein [Agromyces laixinhei]